MASAEPLLLAAGVETPALSPRVFTYHRPKSAVVAALFSRAARDLVEPAGAHHPAWLSHCFPNAKVISVRQGSELAGLFATTVERWRWGLPVAVVTSAHSNLAFDGTPLVARDEAEATIAAFLAAEPRRPILLKAIPAEGEFLAVLRAAAMRLDSPVRIMREWHRAALLPRGQYERWFETNFDRKRRKEYRRLRTRLGEEGRLESIAFDAGELVDPWIEALLALEAKGWKGKQGTAVACDPAMKSALTAALRALALEGALRFWTLSLDGRAIASMFALVAGGKAWLGKIAYDEDFAKFSPGVLLILDATKALFEEASITLVDSCAMPNHPMIDNIWRARIAMCDVLIGPPGIPSTVFDAMVRAETLRGRLRAIAKSFYCRLTGRRMS